MLIGRISISRHHLLAGVLELLRLAVALDTIPFTQYGASRRACRWAASPTNLATLREEFASLRRQLDELQRAAKELPT